MNSLHMKSVTSLAVLAISFVCFLAIAVSVVISLWLFGASDRNSL